MKKLAAPIVALCMVLTAACGGGGSDGGSSEGGNAEIDKAGSYVFADSRIAETFDPHKASDNYDVRWLAPVYDRLVHAQADGSIGPGLALSWKYTDDTTLSLVLREGVTFHDGTPFDAAAVKANLERAKSLPDASPVTKTAVAPIETVEVVDPSHVTLHLNRAAYGLIYDLAIQPGFMISPAAFDNPDLATNPVGTGMYKIKKVFPGDRAEYVRNDDYWDPDAAAAQELTLISMPNADTRLNAVISGQVDTTFLESRQVNAAKSGGLEPNLVPTLSFYNLFSNLTLGGLDNLKVRQAVAYAIDRPALTKIVAGDPSVQPFPSKHFAFSPDVKPDAYAYSPDKAKKLLKEAGHPDGITLDIQVYNRPEDQQLTELLMSQMKKANITLNPKVVDPAGAELYTSGEVPLFLGRFGGRLDPLQTLRTIAGPGGGLNIGSGSTPKFADLLTKIDATQDADKREPLLQAASKELVDAALVYPLFIRSLAYVSNDCVVGFKPYLSGSDEYRGVGKAKGCK